MKGPINDRKNVAGAEKQLESMVYRLTQERGSWPLLTPRLENVKDKTKDTAPLLIRQICELLQDQLEHSDKRGLTEGAFTTSANETTIAGFWREYTKGDLRTRESYKILSFLSPYSERKYMDEIFYAGNTIFETFVQDLLSISINLLLALYLVYPRYLFNMGPAFMFSRGRIDGYLTLVLLTHGNGAGKTWTQCR